MAETICMTGKGMVNGALVTRPDWEARITAAGHYNTSNAANCTVLVASRHDTVKAINARARGARVEDYNWLAAFLRGSLARPAPTPAPPAKQKPIDTTEMEGNDLWGMF